MEIVNFTALRSSMLSWRRLSVWLLLTNLIFVADSLNCAYGSTFTFVAPVNPADLSCDSNEAGRAFLNLNNQIEIEQTSDVGIPIFQKLTWPRDSRRYPHTEIQLTSEMGTLFIFNDWNCANILKMPHANAVLFGWDCSLLDYGWRCKVGLFLPKDEPSVPPLSLEFNKPKFDTPPDEAWKTLMKVPTPVNIDHDDAYFRKAWHDDQNDSQFEDEDPVDMDDEEKRVVSLIASFKKIWTRDRKRAMTQFEEDVLMIIEVVDDCISLSWMAVATFFFAKYFQQIYQIIGSFSRAMRRRGRRRRMSSINNALKQLLDCCAKISLVYITGGTIIIWIRAVIVVFTFDFVCG